jgi:hypothetical protein
MWTVPKKVMVPFIADVLAVCISLLIITWIVTLVNGGCVDGFFLGKNEQAVACLQNRFEQAFSAVCWKYTKKEDAAA